jgi:tetratricopeptide (TPR) repeat protein
MSKLACSWKIGLVFVFAFLGCSTTTMQVAKEVQSGRMALRLSDPKAAIPHFEEAARQNPDYITDFTPLKIGIWTYLGRSYYETGDMEKALANLRRARERHPDGDYVAPLYLGLVVVNRDGRAEAAKQIEEGLRGLHAWLETLPSTIHEGQYWDPGKNLLNSMSQTLSMLQAKEVDWKEVTENVRWLGRKLDEEVEEVRKQKAREREGNGKDRDGGGVGR